MADAVTHNAPSTVQVNPYIFFYGRCEEALEFYKGVFGGTYLAMRNSETPMADRVAAELQGKIMHAKFTAPGVTFMAADGRGIKPVDPEAGNVSLSLDIADRDEGERIFKLLSEGGWARTPLQDAFWGGRFANLNDRFGTNWLITCP